PAPYLFEASELNMMNGRYVYTYNTSWSDRNDWNSYAKRGSYPSPSSCSMCYMVTDDPLNPNAWEYKGEYVPNPGNFGFGWGNNHTHLQKFQGNYYLFYHSMVLEQNMNTGASGFRSIGVEKVTVNESKQQINKVTMTNQGPAAIKKMDPYSLQQAETMSTSGGINYEDFSNIVKVTTLNSIGNDASKNLQVKMNKGAWTMVRNVDFGSEGANSFTLRTKGTGKLEIRLDNPNAKAAATVEFSSSVFLNHTVSVDPTLFKGVKKIFFMFMEATNVYFDSWQFSLEQPSGIQPFVSAEKTPSAVYDLSGRKHLSNQGLKSGVYIRDGKKVVVK
ncbi:MAG: carbohydrate-binding protein, partial [Prevotella sp.]|nr:carbohydrate-binding protein [Prevotella sp.]